MGESERDLRYVDRRGRGEGGDIGTGVIELTSNAVSSEKQPRALERGPGSSFQPVTQWATLNAFSGWRRKNIYLRLIRCTSKKDIFSLNFRLLASYPCKDR